MDRKMPKITQELWMQPDVWEWADQDPGTKSTVRRLCSRDACQKVETEVAQFKRCAACKTVTFHCISLVPAIDLCQVNYCSAECQKKDWKAHKPSKILSTVLGVYIDRVS